MFSEKKHRLGRCFSARPRRRKDSVLRKLVPQSEPWPKLKVMPVRYSFGHIVFSNRKKKGRPHENRGAVQENRAVKQCRKTVPEAVRVNRAVISYEPQHRGEIKAR